MAKVGLNITQKEFKQLSKWAEEVYNIAVIVDYFCETQPDKEDCYNLAPVVKYLHHNVVCQRRFMYGRSRIEYHSKRV